MDDDIRVGGMLTIDDLTEFLELMDGHGIVFTDEGLARERIEELFNNGY